MKKLNLSKYTRSLEKTVSTSIALRPDQIEALEKLRIDDKKVNRSKIFQDLLDQFLEEIKKRK